MTHGDEMVKIHWSFFTSCDVAWFIQNQISGCHDWTRLGNWVKTLKAIDRRIPEDMDYVVEQWTKRYRACNAAHIQEMDLARKKQTRAWEDGLEEW